MIDYKKIISSKICFTELVYQRINKKLKISLSNEKIEEMINTIINETDSSDFKKKGKNIYITNKKSNIVLTVNSSTNRIITAGRLKIQ
jgi:PBP1b-binding outer membrane lipoprotein LpoB